MEREICLEHQLGAGLEFQPDYGLCFHGVYDLGEETEKQVDEITNYWKELWEQSTGCCGGFKWTRLWSSLESQ